MPTATSSNLEEVSNKAVVSHLKDGSFRVLVDGYNYLGVFHSSKMLDGTGNTHSNIQLLYTHTHNNMQLLHTQLRTALAHNYIQL